MKLQDIRNADQAMGLVREFTQTAALLDKVQERGIRVKKQGFLSHVFLKRSGGLNVLSNDVTYKAGPHIFEILLHEFLHLEQLGNAPILKDSVGFYSGRMDRSQEKGRRVLSPEGMMLVGVLLELAVNQPQMKLMHNIEKQTGSDGYVSLHPQTYSYYKSLMETGKVTIELADRQDGFCIEIPDEYKEDADNMENYVLNLCGQLIYCFGEGEDGKLYRDAYAQELLSAVLYNPRKAKRAGHVDFVSLDDEVIRAIGMIGGMDVFHAPLVWRQMLESPPLLGNNETVAMLSKANRDFDI